MELLTKKIKQIEYKFLNQILFSNNDDVHPTYLLYGITEAIKNDLSLSPSYFHRYYM